MSADPNHSIRVGGVDVAYGPNGELLTKATLTITGYADSAAVKAIALTDTARVDGTVITKLDDYTRWIYEASSTAAVDAWHIIPTVQASSAGTWARVDPSLADLASTAAGSGSNLLGDFGTGHFLTAATKTTAFSAAIDVLYYLSVTSAVVAQLPALSAYNEGRRVSFFNNSTSAAVITPTGSDLLAVSGGAGATAATAAGPTGGNMATYVSMYALGKWVKWA